MMIFGKKLELAKLIKYFLPLLCLVVVLGAVYYGLKQHSQSWYFQDETEHLTHGWMMWRFGKTVYTDLSVNHQPLPFFVGALLTKFVPYNTLFLLVERIRVSMLLLLSAWLVIITWRFRWRGLFVSSIIALTSYWFFGWYLLGETLAVPALALSLGLLLDKIFHLENKTHLPATKNKLEWLDPALFALSSAWITLSLSPLWPYVLISGLTYAWLSSNKNRILMASIFIILFSSVFFIISPFDWYRESITNVTKYVVDINGPKTADETYLTAFTYPLQSFFHLDTSLGQFFFWQNVLLIIAAIIALKSKKTKLQDWIKWLVIVALVLSLNNRVFLFPTMFYSGFHLYPLITAWSVLAIQFGNWAFKKAEKKWLLVCYITIALIIFGQILPWVFEKQDKVSEHFINYGDFQSAASLIQVIKSPTDTLLTGPDGHGYINIIADVPISGKELFHLPWAWRSPEIRQEFQKMLVNNPPTYVLFDQDKENGFHEAIKPLLDKDYTYLKRSDGRESKIMVRNDKLLTITAEQKKMMNDLYFMTPEQLIETKDHAKI